MDDGSLTANHEDINRSGQERDRVAYHSYHKVELAQAVTLAPGLTAYY